MRIVIIGGGIAGIECAKRLRLLNEKLEIILIEKKPYLSSSKSSLPFYIGGFIENDKEILTSDIDTLMERYKIDIRTNSEAIGIKTGEKSIVVKGKEEYDLSYDKLILALGSKTKGSWLEKAKNFTNTFSLDDLDDARMVKDFISMSKPKNAVIIGGGLKGINIAEKLVNIGLEVSIAEARENILPVFDIEMGSFIRRELKNKGVKSYIGNPAEGISNSGKTIVLKDGKRIQSDLSILALDDYANNDLISFKDIKTGDFGGIKVDEYFETSIDDIFAIGDISLNKNRLTGKDEYMPLTSIAKDEGRTLADNLEGYTSADQGRVKTLLVKVFDKLAGFTGLSEKYLIDNDFSYKSVHYFSANKDLFTGKNNEILVKLIFNPENGEIYGSQALGDLGVDKIIDLVSACIKAGLRIEGLKSLDYCNTPNSISLSNPLIDIAGIASDLSKGIIDNIQWYEVDLYLQEGWKILDVRSESEAREDGKITGSINISLDDLRDNLSKLNLNQAYLVTCQSGSRGIVAERILRQNGFTVKNLDGGFRIYSEVLPERIIPYSNEQFF